MILIGMPSGESIHPVTMMAIQKLLGASEDVAYTGMVGTYVEKNQNLLVARALELDASHLMLIDSDMDFPPSILRTLLSRKVDIVGCAYRTRQPPHPFTTIRKDGERSTTDDTGLRDVQAVASGMLLIRRKVLEALPYPWFFNSYGASPAHFVGNDVSFCGKARSFGFKVHCDFFASRDVGHMSGSIRVGWGGA
jgi:hypothetical protein